MNTEFWMELTINIFLALLSAYVVYEFYKTFFELCSQRIKIWISIIIYIVWQIFSMPAVLNIPAAIRTILSMVFIAVVGCCFAGALTGKLIFAIIYNAIWALSELLLGAFFLNTGISIAEYNFLGSFLCETLMLILVKLLQLFFRHDAMRNFSWKYNGVLMLLPLGCLFFSYHLFTLSAASDKNSNFGISIAAFVAILIVVFIIFFMYIRLVDTYELKRKNDIYQLEIQLYTEHMKEKESTMEEFRKSKHDLKHRLLYLLELMKKQNYEKMEEYVEELIEFQSRDGLMVANTDNSFIDAQINFKYSEATKQGINFQADLDIPSSMPFDNADLCVILGNVLDNAIEANIKENIREPYINLKMKYKAESLVIIIENTFDGFVKKDKKGRLLTRKGNKSEHGYGLNSIQNVIAKYHGYMNIDIVDTIFKLTVVMYQPEF